MKKKFTIIILLISVTLSFFSACSQENLIAIGNSEDEYDNVEYAMIDSGKISLPLTTLKTLNPLMTNNLSYFYFNKLISEGLFDFDENLMPAPKLANSYNISGDGKTVSLNLRDDVYWHDGQKFTSNDVLFTINTLKNIPIDSTYGNTLYSAMGNFSSGQGLQKISGRIIDEYNIDISFDMAFSNILEVLTFPIIPSHRLNSTSALAVEGYIPIGTGPYKFVEYDKFKSLTLVANENYREGKPTIESIVGKILESEELILSSFDAGQINIAPISEVDWEKYRQYGRTSIIEYVSSNYDFLVFNFENNLLSVEEGKAIRQAINHAINRKDMIEKIFLGHASINHAPLHPKSWLNGQYKDTYGYNLSYSNDILDQAGFIDSNGDGIRENKDGQNLQFKITTNNTNIFRIKAAEMIRDNLKEVGINTILDVSPKYKDVTEEDRLNDLVDMEKKLQSGNFDIALIGMQMSVIPELSFMYHSNQISNNNFGKYISPQMDQYLFNAHTAYSQERKLAAYRELLNFISEDVPNVSLYYRNNAILVDSMIMGELTPTFFNPYLGIEKCFVVEKVD